MKGVGRQEVLYILNSTLLFTHEVDSGYWKEWIMFGIPGGIQLYLVMNIFLVAVGLIGLRFVILQKRSGQWFSLIQAICGIFAFTIHGIFILSGYSEFTLPMSEILLIIILFVSVIQGSLAVFELVTIKRLF
jgi:hypothetical protein